MTYVWICYFQMSNESSEGGNLMIFFHLHWNNLNEILLLNLIQFKTPNGDCQLLNFACIKFIKAILSTCKKIIIS